VGPRASLDAVEKRKISFLSEESNPTVQPVAVATEISQLNLR
jgi:hypothetical protein